MHTFFWVLFILPIITLIAAMRLLNLAAFIPLVVSATAAATDTCAPADLTASNLTKVGLDYDFHMYVPLETPIDIGAGAWGVRHWIAFSGGAWCAKWNNGTTGTLVVSNDTIFFNVNNIDRSGIFSLTQVYRGVVRMPMSESSMAQVELFSIQTTS
jgi:hypothetical protein